MDDIVRHSADAAIWAAIDSKNFKQAIKAVDKRLAKKPADLYLKALKLYIRAYAAKYTGQETYEHAALILELSVLAEGGISMGSDEVIALYEEALALIMPGPHKVVIWASILGELRWLAVKNNPKDVETGIHHFSVCLSKGDLKHSQQIANSLDKNFPNEHLYHLWNITIHHLITKSRFPNHQEKDLSGRLSRAMIMKLAEATKEAKDAKSLPTRAIQTPQESFLLHSILSQGSSYEERLKYYEDEYLGPDSKVSKSSWKLWLDKLALMKEAGRWRELYKLCSTMLARARKNESGQVLDPRMGDWLVWDAFLASAGHVYTDEIRYMKTLLEIQAHLDENSGVGKVYRRNAALAEVLNTFKYLANTPQPYLAIKKPYTHSNSGKDVDEDVLDPYQAVCQKSIVLLKYLDSNREVYSAFDDIRTYIALLTHDDRSEFLIRLASNGRFGIGVLPFEQLNETTLAKTPCQAEYNLTNSGEITACLLKFKLRYLIMSSLSETERLTCPNQDSRDKSSATQFICKWCAKPCGIWCHFCLETLARLSILTYGSAIDDNGRITNTLLPTDTHPADDFCILATMCLVKLVGNTPWREEICCEPLDGVRRAHLLRATILLEYAWSHSKANSKISLLLVRLYSQLGCGSLAMRAFQRLGIKQIQFTTLAYILFDRISSLHPHPFAHLQDNTSRTRSPIEQLEKHQKVYRSFSAQIQKNIFRAFEHGSYDSAVQLVEASDAIVSSQVAIMSFIESRKIARIIQPKEPVLFQSHGYDLLPPQAELLTNYTENFDLKSFPNFECADHPAFIQYTRNGPDLGAQRCRWALLSERVTYHVDPRSSEMGRVATLLWFQNEYPLLRRTINVTREASSSMESSELSIVERTAYSVYGTLAEIIYQNPEGRPQLTPDIKTSLESINKALRVSLSKMLGLVKKVKIGNTVPGFASTLHPLYVAHEVASTVLNFDKYFNSKSKAIDKYQLEANKATVVDAKMLMEEVLDRSEKVRRGMDESGWIDKVLDSLLEGDVDEEGQEPSTLAGALKATIRAEFMESWAGEVVESWRDSVAGLSCLKKVE